MADHTPDPLDELAAQAQALNMGYGPHKSCKDSRVWVIDGVVGTSVMVMVSLPAGLITVWLLATFRAMGWLTIGVTCDKAKATGESVRRWLACLVFGPHYTAVVRMDYDDRFGRGSVTTRLPPFRARNRLAAACGAIRLAQRDSVDGWKSVHLEALNNVRT